MTEDPDLIDETPAEAAAPSPELVAAVARLDRIFAHLWMVRTFVKHSPEVEDFPELMGAVRSVFDASRAVETRRGNPAGMFRMARKKLAKLKIAAAEFRKDAPTASDHTNFRMAVASFDGAVAELADLLEAVGA